MPHEFEQGFFVREPAWHNLGDVLADYPGRQEAMKRAGHDWQVIERPVFMSGSEEIDGWKALCRGDTYKVLSVVKASYEPIQNDVLWDVLDAIVQEPNVQYETAGVLKEGRLLWAMAKLQEPWRVPGDDSDTMPYICAGLGHDGETPLQAWLTALRVVCANTFQASLRTARKGGLYFSFKHTRNVMSRIEEARAALQGIREQFEEYKAITTELAETKVDNAGVEKFVTTLIPEPEEEEATDKVRENVEEGRARYIEMLQGLTVAESHRRTSYGLFCAGLEFLEYGRKAKSDETLFTRCVQPSSEKTKLVELSLAVAK